jgi:hypothetical protein
MKYFFLLIILFSLNTYANEKVRPGPHNKMGHTKQSVEDKKDGFFYKLLNDELDFSGSDQQPNNNQILSQIEKLADLNKRGIITDDEFKDKKSLLLEKIQ